MDGEAVYVHMINKYFTKEKAIWTDSMTVYGLQQRAGEMAQSLTGQPGPNITVPDVDGNPKTLYDLKAPYLIVYMYNPTCEHCIEETPKLVNFLRGRNDVEVFAVALDTEVAPWKKFIQDFGTQNWTNVYDPSNRSIYKTYFVDHTPELYLLNADRKIIGKNLKASQIEEVINRDKQQ
jgi:peroxiredoxin